MEIQHTDGLYTEEGEEDNGLERIPQTITQGFLFWVRASEYLSLLLNAAIKPEQTTQSRQSESSAVAASSQRKSPRIQSRAELVRSSPVLPLRSPGLNFMQLET